MTATEDAFVLIDENVHESSAAIIWKGLDFGTLPACGTCGAAESPMGQRFADDADGSVIASFPSRLIRVRTGEKQNEDSSSRLRHRKRRYLPVGRRGMV